MAIHSPTSQAQNTLSLLDQLHETLIREIPTRLRDYDGDDPAACLHLIYYDSHAPVGYLDLRITTESKRAESCADDLSEFWDNAGQPGNVSLDDMDGPLFDRVYEFTTESGKEEDHMELYRESLAKAAFEINETLPLEAFPKLTNDFVVVLADGSRWGSGEPENVLMCISKEKRRMLMDRGFWREDDRY